MSEFNIKSPAKINLYLKILGKLSNGFHELDTSFQLINLYDDICFKKTKKGISVKCNNKDIDNHKNIVFKIANDLQKQTKNNGIEIQIKKRIPVGAGLGGGSSNAASAIVMLDKIWGLNLNRNKMLEYAKEIGADVPFFMFGKNAKATGIGEKLKYSESIDSNILIIHPEINNSTKIMFNLYDQSSKKNVQIPNFRQNSFWSIFLNSEETVKDFYYENFKEFELNLSGSGSSMFVKYNKKEEIDKLVKKIPSNWRLFFCKPLQYSPICYID